METSSPWWERADAARAAVLSRHVTPLWHIPTTRLGVPGWPATRRDRHFVSWNYWWQAHLIDCAVDAAVRAPSDRSQLLVRRLIRGQRVRNVGTVVNKYYDDMAWLALALERAQRLLGIDSHRALQTLSEQFMNAWAPEAGGGIPWRTTDQFFNTPANGPAGIFLARFGNRSRALDIAEWLAARLVDPKTGLMFDGIEAGGKLHPEFYTYCQGVTIGLESTLSVSADETHARRVSRLVEATRAHLATDDVVHGAGGGDGGLFAGILLRYLAVAARELDGDGSADDDTREIATDLVLASAEAAWRGAIEVDGHVLFAADWTRSARMPGIEGGVARFSGGSVSASSNPERDLSVQLGGWMAMEAAYAVSTPAEPYS